MTELPKRVHPRLRGYDYSRSGGYFLTLCTQGRAPILSEIVGRVPGFVSSLKRYTNRVCGRPLWQASYHDHIIRDENDLLNHWSYIEHNPARWAEDEYHV